MKEFKSIYILLFLLSIMLFSSTNEKRVEVLKSDSLNLSRILWRIKDKDVKKDILSIIDRITYEKRMIQPYPVEFYTEKAKSIYTMDEVKKMSVDDIVDTLEAVFNKSIILKVNKLDLKKLNLNLSIGAVDNFHVDLTKEKALNDKEVLKKILIETILNSHKKSSLEWIWGKNSDEDSYYSTKLTALDGQFSIYPYYRTFIGLDSFRDKSKWFDKLSYFSPLAKPELIADRSEENKKETVADNNFVVTEELFEKEIKKSLKEPETKSIPVYTFSYDVSLYDKSNGSYDLIKRENMNFNEISKNLNGVLEDVQIIYSNTGNNKEVSVVSSLSIDEKKNLISSLLNEAGKDKGLKKTIELITSRKKKSSFYYTAVLTTYEGQLSIFKNYQKIAHSSISRDKSSWFYKLPIKKN